MKPVIHRYLVIWHARRVLAESARPVGMITCGNLGDDLPDNSLFTAKSDGSGCTCLY